MSQSFSPNSEKEFYVNPWSSNQRWYKTVDISAPTYVYIYDFSFNKELVLKNLLPQAVGESYSPNIIKESGIFGRAYPLNFYTGGSGKTLSFSLDIHEDLLPSDKTLYEILNYFEYLTNPVISPVKKTVTGHEVYLQIGEQFAGRGHLNVNYSLQKPFRNGRYTMSKVNFTFTFHEEFNNLDYTFNDRSTTEYNSNLLPQQSDLFRNNLYGIGAYYGINTYDIDTNALYDFATEVWDYDFIKTLLFTNEKLLYGLFKEPSDPKSYSEIGAQVGKSGASDLYSFIYNTPTFLTRNTHGGGINELDNYVSYADWYVQIINFYVEALNVLTTYPVGGTASKLNNIRILKDKINQYIITTKSSTGTNDFTGREELDSLLGILLSYEVTLTNIYAAGE